MTTGQLLNESLAADPVYATCDPAVAYAVREWREKGYPGATETTQRLLAWWFDTDHQVDGRPFAFYPAQRAAIEALIYVYEVKQRRDNRALLEAFARIPERRAAEGATDRGGARPRRRGRAGRQGDGGVAEHLLADGDYARYGVKMATGSGKTMVMALAVAWSYLNAVNEPECVGYAKSFLIIAPGVIVFERLHGDFAGGAIFRNYPLIPPEYAAEWSEVRFFMRGDRAEGAGGGALYLTNIQQLYDSPAPAAGPKQGNIPGPIAAILGPAASDKVEPRDNFVDRIVRRQALVMVLNDEAHHTHDEESEWNKTIRRLRERLGGGRFMAQVDFSATPRFNDGTLFPWVIYDYPLAQAIRDGIVKQPIRGEIRGAGETAAADASVRYAAYITAAVRRWQEYREQLTPLGKKPVLFAMLETAKDADAVGAALQRDYPAEFGGDQLQVIHIDRAGEVSSKDLERARRVVKDIDAADSAVNAVVSVMMLREGWDVRNVSVVLGLRPYSAKANILPEQAIGRGLRLMFPGDSGPERGYTERVDIIGTDKFIEFVAELEKLENIAVPVEDLDRQPITIVTIHPDADKLAMDIALPSLSPIYARKTDTRQEIAGLDIDALEVEKLPFSLAARDEEKFRYLGLDALTDATLLERIYNLPQPNTCGEVIGYYAARIGAEANLPGHFAEIAGKVREFFARRAFGQAVDLDDNALAAVLARPAVGYLTVLGFLRAIRPLTRQEREPVIATPAQRLAQTEPFPWSRPTCPAGKTVFNLVAADNDFEREFAQFLEAAPDVARFAKLPLRLGFRIQYVANTGNLRHYYPDFAAVDGGGVHYLLETKGLEDPNVVNKDRAARLWCANARRLTGTEWRFVKVGQVGFNELAGRTLADAVNAFAVG